MLARPRPALANGLLHGLLVAMLTASIAPAAWASSMLESYRSRLEIQFENQDLLQVRCSDTDGECVLHLRVNGRGFEFDSASLGGVHIQAEGARLYSGAGSARDRYFSFEIDTSCPEEVQISHYRCSASVLVQEGAPPDVDFIRRRDEYVKWDASAPPRPMQWEPWFTGPRKEALEAAEKRLIALGYASDGIDDFDNDRKVWSLTARKVQDYSPATYAERKAALQALADEFDVRLWSLSVSNTFPPAAQDAIP